MILILEGFSGSLITNPLCLKSRLSICMSPKKKMWGKGGKALQVSRAGHGAEQTGIFFLDGEQTLSIFGDNNPLNKG